MSDTRTYIPPNTEINILKEITKTETAAVRDWPWKWGWMLDEYKDLTEKLGKITEKSLIIHKKEITEHRTVRPVPNSVNHEYGWLAGRPEFRLEVYGSDIYQAEVLPRELRLF